jgi:hypothetical protein
MADVNFINEYFRALFPDEDIREFVKMFLAHTAFDEPDGVKYSMILVSPTASGKTTLMNIHEQYLSNYLKREVLHGDTLPDRRVALMLMPDVHNTSQYKYVLSESQMDMMADPEVCNIILCSDSVPSTTNVHRVPEILLVENTNHFVYNPKIFEYITEHMDAYHDVLDAAYKSLKAYYNGDLELARPKILSAQTNRWLSNSLKQLWERLKIQ